MNLGASPQLEYWNNGMVEYWNDGFKRIFIFVMFYRLPIFHHSIIP